MKSLIAIEELSILLFCYIASLYLSFAWWLFPVWLLAPDISMAGYLLNSRHGAISYNLFHHKGMAVFVGAAGLLLKFPELQFAGLILFGHSSLDRLLGYGLKYSDSFYNTHLGFIGKQHKS